LLYLYMPRSPVTLCTAMKLPFNDEGSAYRGSRRNQQQEFIYFTGFLLEASVVIVYALVRVDLQFHVPDGSCSPGDE
jgi:hypothetical protein